MSSYTKDPLENQDTPSESSDSQSDSEVDKAEENLEQLKIEERVTKEPSKDDANQSKPSDDQNQEGNLKIKCDLSNEPIAGPSGLQNPRLRSTEGSKGSKSKVDDLTGPLKENIEMEDIDENIATKTEEKSDIDEKEMKGIDENIGAEMEENTDSTTSSTSPFIQSSTGITATSRLQRKFPVGRRMFRDDVDYGKLAMTDVVHRFMCRHSPPKSSGSKRIAYATDSANTSADVSEIRSEIADSSTEGSVYHEAQENLEKEQSPSYASAVEVQSSENSDTSKSISELQDDYIRPPTPASSNVSSSTPSGEQGHRAYLAQLQREAEARGEPISTSSGIGSTNQSELAHLKAWNEAGEIGFYRRNPDDPSDDISDLGAQGGEPSVGDQQMQDFDRLFEQEKQNEDNVGPNVPEDVPKGSVARRKQRAEERVRASSLGVASPSKRRRSPRGLSASSVVVKGTPEKHKPKRKPDAGTKGKMVTSKSSPALKSSSESTEPKSSSSEELPRKESPEVKSLGGAQEGSQAEKSRKSWQKSGLLRSMQLSTASSKETVVAEEEDRSSPIREQDTESMGTKDATPEKMDITPEKAEERSATNTEQSESKPSVVSSDQAYGSETEGTLKGLESPDFQRAVGKSKREPKLSSSPPSDEKVESPPAKAATNRPKKKAKSEKTPVKPRRTRNDSGGTVPKSISLGNLQQSESTSTPDISDYTPSDDDKETAL